MAFTDINNRYYLPALFIFAFIETLMCTGVVYGWASIVVVFKLEHFYLYLCRSFYEERNLTFPVMKKHMRNMSYDTQEFPHCPAQEKIFDLIFTISVICAAIILLPAGILIDKRGPRIVSIIGGLLYLAAALGLGFVTIGYEWLLFPIFVCFAIGGNLQAVSLFQVCNVVFQSRKSFVISVINGAFDSSPVVLLILKLMYEHGVSLQRISLQYIAVCVLVIATGLILLIPPRRTIFQWMKEQKGKGRRNFEDVSGNGYCNSKEEGGQGSDNFEEEREIGRHNCEIIPEMGRYNFGGERESGHQDFKEERNTHHQNCNEPTGRELHSVLHYDISIVSTTDLSEPVMEKRSTRDVSEPVTDKRSTTDISEPVTDKRSTTDISEPVMEKRSTADLSEHVIDKQFKSEINTKENHENSSRSMEKCIIFENHPLLKSIFSSLYLMELLFLSTVTLKLIYFVGSLDDYLGRLSHNNIETVSHYVSIFASIQLGGLVVTPLIGAGFDRDTLFRSCDDQDVTSPEEKRLKKLKQCIAPLTLTIVLCIILCVLALFDDIALQIPQYILYTIVRGFLYACNGAYIAVVFPTSQFGTLFGLGMFVSAVFGLLNYALFELTNGPFHGNAFYTNVILLILVSLSIMLPFNVWRTCRLEDKKLSSYPTGFQMGSRQKYFRLDENTFDQTNIHIYT